MHLLMIAPEQIPVPGGGSVEICMHAIAKQWAKHHKVTIVSRRSSRLAAKSTDGNLTILRVGSGSPDTYLSHVLRRVSGQRFDWIQVDNRPRFLRRVKAAFPHTPVSIFLHSLTFVSSSDSSRCLGHADLIVGNSLNLKQELTRRFPAHRSKLRHVHLGVDLGLFRPPSHAERARLRRKHLLGGGYTVAFAGRVIPRKGVDVLVRAIGQVRKSVPGVKLVVAGGGKSGYIAGLRRLSKQHGVSARFLGRLPHRRVREAYWMADCFVCPSQKHEAFGLVNVEAMSTGLPCIASRIGGIGEIVNNERNGLLVGRYREPRAFAEAIRRLAGNRSLAHRLGRQAREDMKHKFHWRKTAGSLAGLYGDYLKS